VNEPIHKVLAAGLSAVVGGDAVVFTAVWLPVAIGVPLVVSAWLHAYLEVPGLHWGRAAADRLGRRSGVERVVIGEAQTASPRVMAGRHSGGHSA
jgi:hypothetical protein